ncbi:Phenylpyruvate tautomerase PptA, 4-oxalocrotonate tautomerase family [Roseivivax lentus]|uniref:Phenylpyruvate tautomerase PptA, 4-oxalocrotonate tautomerase family n=1 Tax=Roseivivax lentus TaxID=633194 RepID=A0A1N7KWK8_9RHOB|nr:tautomerase family protein [Roseivivax lentus]SIS65988.1 Phenylpyruvate tautomerase PptA, 4-oxalocrotonate tautomerase family [Roseivivax lentus]
MPILELHVLEGYDDDAKRRLAEGLTDAVRVVMPAPPDAVTVMIHERATSQYMRGRRQRTGAPALPDPCRIVRDYLAAMEARDVDAAAGFLGEGFTMVFPGSGPMTSLQELIDWSAPRYRFVRKTYEGFDLAPTPGPAVVYARGTLSGAWPDGTPFEGIRFIDRFEITEGRITRQDVWNDIAEVRP